MSEEVEETQTPFRPVLTMSTVEEVEVLLEQFHQWREANVPRYRAERWQTFEQLVDGRGTCFCDPDLLNALREQAEETRDFGFGKEVAEAALGSLRPLADLSEEELVQVMGRYREWEAGITITEEDLPMALTYDGVLYKVNQPHTTQSDWIPGQGTDALYSPITPEGFIDEWSPRQGAHDAYGMGVRVIHNGQTWESNHPANVWEPGTVGTENLWILVE